MIEEFLDDAIRLVNQSKYAYCHYITPNDVGATGGHQCGFTFAKPCYRMFFDEPGIKGNNKDVFIEISWQNIFKTTSRAIYYGTGTRDEYRITRFGRGFEFMNEDYVGSLQIMTKDWNGEYNAYVLSNQDNIENFMASFNLDITKGNQWINVGEYSPEHILNAEFKSFIDSHNDFPDTKEMATYARESVCKANHYTDKDITNRPDSIILEWASAEFELFGGLEEKIYGSVFAKPFKNCQELINFSNTILNRRKSRAGKSLEHNLSAIFNTFNLHFEEQVITEGNKKPDFIFPDGTSYHNFMFPAEKLTMLGAKTTCKDRWRQVLNEANRIDNKHLFTLQLGVSKNQLKEMKEEKLTLVIPKSNFQYFPIEFRKDILDLKSFILMVKEKQER